MMQIYVEKKTKKKYVFTKFRHLYAHTQNLTELLLEVSTWLNWGIDLYRVYVLGLYSNYTFLVTFLVKTTTVISLTLLY